MTTAGTRHINIDNQDGVLILKVIDRRLSEHVQVTEWKNEMADAIRSAAPRGVVIDLKNVEYMTSVALFPLIATRSVAEQAGARLVLCNLSDTVAQVLTVSQLIVESRAHANHLSMAETIDDALQIFRQSPVEE